MSENNALNWPRPQMVGALFFASVFAMSVHDISIIAFAIGIGPSLVYASPACMTETEARAKFPKEPIYSHQHCWNIGAALGHSPRDPTGAALPGPSPRPALA